MHPRIERAQWGLEKGNQLVRVLLQGNAHLRTRMELHIKLSGDHAKAAMVCYDQDLGWPAQLHSAAALSHMKMANWLMAALRQQLTPEERGLEIQWTDEAVTGGLRAVVKTKEATYK